MGLGSSARLRLISHCVISLFGLHLSASSVSFFCPFLSFALLSFCLFVFHSLSVHLLCFTFISLLYFPSVCLSFLPSTHISFPFLSFPFLSFPFLPFVINLPQLSPCPLPLGLVGLWLATISGFLTGCVSVFKCCCGKQHYTTLFFLPSVWLQ